MSLWWNTIIIIIIITGRYINPEEKIRGLNTQINYLKKLSLIQLWYGKILEYHTNIEAIYTLYTYTYVYFLDFIAYYYSTFNTRTFFTFRCFFTVNSPHRTDAQSTLTRWNNLRPDELCTSHPGLKSRLWFENVDVTFRWAVKLFKLWTAQSIRTRVKVSEFFLIFAKLNLIHVYRLDIYVCLLIV